MLSSNRLVLFGPFCCLSSCQRDIFLVPINFWSRMIISLTGRLYRSFLHVTIVEREENSHKQPICLSLLCCTLYVAFSILDDGTSWILHFQPVDGHHLIRCICRHHCNSLHRCWVDRHDRFHVSTSFPDWKWTHESRNLADHSYLDCDYLDSPQGSFVSTDEILVFRLLVGVSSMGMISMIASLVILFVYGLCTTSFTFKTSYLYPHSTSGFLSNLGLFVHSLAFILFLLSNTVTFHYSINE